MNDAILRELANRHSADPVVALVAWTRLERAGFAEAQAVHHGDRVRHDGLLIAVPLVGAGVVFRLTAAGEILERHFGAPE
jgi:hypothetical protein